MVKESGTIFPQCHPLSLSHQTSPSTLWQWRHCLLIGRIDRKWSKQLRTYYSQHLSSKMWALPFSSSRLRTLSEQRESSAAVWAWSSTELLLLSFPAVLLSFWSERGGLNWVLLLTPPLKKRQKWAFTDNVPIKPFICAVKGKSSEMKSTQRYLMVGLLEGMDFERLSGGVSTSDGLWCLSGDSSLFQLLDKIQNSVSTDV